VIACRHDDAGHDDKIRFLLIVLDCNSATLELIILPQEIIPHKADVLNASAFIFSAITKSFSNQRRQQTL
jgi:hypothetical protein